MKLNRSKALSRIEGARGHIESLRETTTTSPRFQHWNADTLRLIQTIFPHSSSWEREYRELSFGLLFDSRHRPGGEAEESYRESLDKAGTILAGMAEALRQPKPPPGSDLEVEPEQAAQEADRVLVLHGPDERLVVRITPVILAAKLRRVAIAAWPAEAPELERLVRARGVARAVLVVLHDGDLGPPPNKPNVAPAIPAPIAQAARIAVAVHEAARVRVVVLSRIALPAESFPAPIVAMDSRGVWRLELNHVFAGPKS